MENLLAPSGDRANRLSEDEEGKFRSWITGLPWFSEFKQQYNEEPNLDDPDYDYRAAWKSGIEPQRYAPDNNRYHWPSVTPEGTELKSPNHPTYWAEQFMKETGDDPIALGIKDATEANTILERMRARR